MSLLLKAVRKGLDGRRAYRDYARRATDGVPDSQGTESSGTLALNSPLIEGFQLCFHQKELRVMVDRGLCHTSG
jgi:hypothetical protein